GGETEICTALSKAALDSAEPPAADRRVVRIHVSHCRCRAPKADDHLRVHEFSQGSALRRRVPDDSSARRGLAGTGKWHSGDHPFQGFSSPDRRGNDLSRGCRAPSRLVRLDRGHQGGERREQRKAGLAAWRATPQSSADAKRHDTNSPQQPHTQKRPWLGVTSRRTPKHPPQKPAAPGYALAGVVPTHNSVCPENIGVLRLPFYRGRHANDPVRDSFSGLLQVSASGLPGI